MKFIEKIEDAARDSDIKFEIASISDVGAKDELFKEDVKVDMKVEGSWSKTMSFVDKLEKLPFGVSVRSINLDANASGRWSGAVEFVIFREK